MILGRVVGEVWATRRHSGLDGRKLLLVQPHLWYEPAFQVAHLVAVDTLGAGVGEDVVHDLWTAAGRRGANRRPERSLQQGARLQRRERLGQRLVRSCRG